MKRLSKDVWKTVLNNLEWEGEEVEVVYLDNVGKPGEWGLCFEEELFEDGFKTEMEAIERLQKLERELL